MKTKFFPSLFPLALIVVGCHEAQVKQDFPHQEQETREQRVERGESFGFEISPISGMSPENVQGHGKIHVDEGEVKIKMEVLGAPTHIAQYLLSTSECPSMKEDADGNGTLEESELITWGAQKVLALDDDLRDGAQGGGQFPIPDASGSYVYEGLLSGSSDLHWEEMSVMIYSSENQEWRPLACAAIKKLYPSPTPTSTPTPEPTSSQTVPASSGKGGGKAEVITNPASATSTPPAY